MKLYLVIDWIKCNTTVDFEFCSCPEEANQQAVPLTSICVDGGSVDAVRRVDRVKVAGADREAGNCVHTGVHTGGFDR